MKIWLDAGHGGSDPGACNGSHHEADYVLDITLRLGKILSGEGEEVFYTRRTNSAIPLYSRARSANEAEADLFVSIHINSSPDFKANGIETLIYQTGGEAEELAKEVQAALVDALGWRDRGIKERPNLVVLNSTEMPALLVEAGFISNAKECAALSTPACRIKIAEAIAEKVLAHSGKKYTPSSELISINDIVWEMGNLGLCEDMPGMIAEMEKEPNGRLYWSVRKFVNYIRKKGK